MNQQRASMALVKTASTLKKWALPALIIAVGLAFSLGLALAAQKEISLSTAQRFDAIAADVSRKVEAQFNDYTEVLRGLRALFNTSNVVTRQQFKRYVEGLDLADHFPGFRSLNYAPRVWAADKLAFEQQLRGDIDLEARFAARFAISPAGERAYYHPLTYLEPLAGEGAALGKDISAPPSARQALEQARDSGLLTSSGQKIKIQTADGAPDVGLAMRLPVYRNDLPRDTVEQRRAAYLGSLGAGFSVTEMMRNVLGHDAQIPLRLRWLDGGPSANFKKTDPQLSAELQPPASNEDLLFDSQASNPPNNQAAPGRLTVHGSTKPAHFHRTLTFDGGSRTWVVEVSSTLAYLGAPLLTRAAPWLIFFCGSAISLLMAGVVYSLMTSRARDEALIHALQTAKTAADAANRSKSIFLANMSHEIRTPLTAVIGFSADLLDAGQTVEDRVHGAQTIYRAGKHLLNVIDGILDLTKIEADRLDIERESVALVSLVDEVAELSRLQATAKGLDFSVDHVYPLPRSIDTDPLRLRQILLNLTGNAIKFTARGSVSLRTSYDPGTAQLMIKVTDTGLGIDQSQLAGLFQPFGQADSSISRRFGGTGLGLVLSRKFAELLGGTLEVTSTLGTGSCFKLTLPTTAVNNEWLEQTEHHEPVLPAPLALNEPVGSESRILLAEDNPDNQRLIARHIQRLGVTAQVVHNGELAVQAALASLPHLVLMDMQMPVMDGLTAVRLLRSQGYQGAIVALTANATRDDMQACLDAGCDAYLTKPVDQQQFDQAVRHYLPPATTRLGAHQIKNA
jgi:signal transduction histidine kinase/ActR/RegA family two-component response regulator